jgi:putative transposase
LFKQRNAASKPAATKPVKIQHSARGQSICTTHFDRKEAYMPRRPGRASGRFVFHVLNRAVQGLVIFRSSDEYRQFLQLTAQAATRFGVRILAYCIMPNHWHVVVWPLSDEGLSRFMQWLTGTHAQFWRAAQNSTGRGAVYQGRFKAIAVQCDRHFLVLCRYVERNAVRARLVARAEDWEWSSASPLAGGRDRPCLAAWPVPKPANWLDHLNEELFDGSAAEVRASIRDGAHFGDEGWREEVHEQLSWRSGRGPRRNGASTRPEVTDDSVIRA